MTLEATNRLDDLHAVVTGSTRGIGAAIAAELARAGASVVVHGRSAATAEQAAAKLRGTVADSEVDFAVCDLTEPEAALRLVDDVWRRRPVDVWVNNAGADVLTGPEAEWSFRRKFDLLWRVDVLAAVEASRAVGQAMKGRGRGAIVNIGWDQSDRGMAGDSGEMFAAVKAAVTAFTRSLAKSLAPEVRVNAVAPGWIRTAWGESASQYWQQRACRESLLGRWGEPADVAQAVRFLASPAAAFITGQVLDVNGGWRGSSEE
jgi:3-oxoacyl-[acyl-carrier protein] reductase